MLLASALPHLLLFVADATPLNLATLPHDQQLAHMLLERAPELATARAKVASARAQVTRTEALPNPTLDVSMNTIPVGKTNPPGLENRLASVPNYAAFVAQPIEIGKRGPRQRAARFGAEAALWDAADQLRQTWLEFLAVVGRVASSEQRIAALTDLTEDAAKLTELQHRRAEKGDAAALEYERARLDEERLRSSLSQERQKLSAALADCARLAGTPCEPFGSTDKATAFLDAAQSRAGTAADSLRTGLAERPDIKSFEASEQAAQAAHDLARHRAWPDPEVRVGFVYDTFFESGAQNKSINVGVAIPLPVFERGQADRAEASANLWAARRSRDIVTTQAQLEWPILLRQRDELQTRQARVRTTTLPMARAIVDRIGKAVTAGGAPIQDLLQARRTLGELLQDAADLDVANFEVSLALMRASGGSPLPVDELRTSVMP